MLRSFRHIISFSFSLQDQPRVSGRWWRCL